MAKRLYKNSLLFTLAIVIALSPILQIVSFTKVAHAADTPTDEGTDSPDAGIGDGGFEIPNMTPEDPNSCAITHTCKPEADPFEAVFQSLEKYSSADSTIKVADILTDKRNAKLILPQRDLQALRALKCTASVVPPYAEDLAALYRDLPAALKTEVDTNIANEKKKEKPIFTTSDTYFTYLKNGFETDTPSIKEANATLLAKYVTGAEDRFDDAKVTAVWQNEAANLDNGKPTLSSPTTIACVVGDDINVITGELQSPTGQKDIAQKIRDFLAKKLIDVRVLKTLVYLLTPKDEGGAGHWRIRVRRILQDDPSSTESDATLESLNNMPVETAQCDSTMTAAECGQQNRTTPNLEITDPGGAEYVAWLNDLQKQEDDYLSDRNISAHYTGQGVDISEIDDIRCTIVEKHRIGADTTKKQPIRPIKLAWQTQEGYSKSGGASEFDTMSMMKGLAADSLNELLTSMNPDMSTYQGDLSKASFTDMAGILGQSILGYMVNSPGQSLGGSDTAATLKNLGAMYLADYLGVPREVFMNENVTNLERVKYLIGRSAIEKKLGLPYGSLDNFDYDASALATKTVDDLDGLLVNLGQRKIEYELGLKAHDLDGYLSTTNVSAGDTSFQNIVGRRAIENGLNLNRNSWPTSGETFVGLDPFISQVRREALSLSPGYVDDTLHLDPGTTAKFINGTLNSLSFVNTAGQARLSDTTFGLKYFAMNNAAYQLPAGTWEGAMKGEKSSARQIGIYTLARLLSPASADLTLTDQIGADSTMTKITLHEKATGVTTDFVLDDPSNPGEYARFRSQFGQYIFREWINSNLTRTSTQTCDLAKSSGYLDLKIKAAAGGQLTITDQIKNSKASLCTLTESISFDAIYKDKSGSSHTLTNQSKVLEVDETNAKTAGLEDLDLYRIMGFKDADGRSVFERIGSKLLYYGVASKLLNPEEKLKIDLSNTNPTLKTTNSEIGFYVDRVLKVEQYSQKVMDDWKVLKSLIDKGEFKDVDAISTSIDAVFARLKNITGSGDSDNLKIEKIFGAVSDVMLLIDQLKQLATQLQGYQSAKFQEVNADIMRVNGFVTDINELLRAVSELIAGKEIPSSDQVSISGINPISLQGSGSSGSRGRELSTFQLATLVFSFLSGRLSAKDLFIRLGANKAEAEIGLPSNSLLYLAQNYEAKGQRNIDALYEAIGQARIEEQFGMPAYYFQGETLNNSPPDFQNNPAELIKVAVWPLLSLRKTSFSAYLRSPDVSDLDALAYIHRLEPDKYKGLVDYAVTKWKTDHGIETTSNGQDITLAEKTITDVIKNVKKRGLNLGLDSAENDLLTRMGMPGKDFAGLVNNSFLAWSMNNSRAEAIDKILKLPTGSTKTLFTGEKTIATAKLSEKDKSLFEASPTLKIGKNLLTKYVQMLNGEILPAESAEYSTNVSDYVYMNPYAQTPDPGNTCPINFTVKDGFSVNETTISNNSFCYYDKKGRHCFQSSVEAQNFALAHPDDRITDVLLQIAVSLANAYNLTFTDKISEEDMSVAVKDFVNHKEKASIFDSATLSKVTGKNLGSDATGAALAKLAFTKMSTSTNVPTEVMLRLFSRSSQDSPLSSYKKIVGQVEAQQILTTQLFDQLGLDINPTLFDGQDFYDILHGDFTSLTRLGTAYIDQALSLPPGTTLLIINAASSNTRKCALAEAGGKLIGGLVGLNYLPIDGLSLGNFEARVGQEKVEETLGLPRGTFRGANMAELEKNVQPINFALAFNLPLATPNAIDTLPIQAILGADAYNQVKNTSVTFQLKTVRDRLLSIQNLSNAQYVALNQLNSAVSAWTQTFLASLTSTDPQIITDSSDAGQAALKNFYKKSKDLDSSFSLAPNSTYKLLTNRMTPEAYSQKVGQTITTRIGLIKLGEVLGLNPDQAEAATKLLTSYQHIFKCSGNILGGVCYDDKGAADPDYHKWGNLYDKLDQIFAFHVDANWNLPTGTMKQVLNDPKNAFPLLLGIGATKLDGQMGLDSSKFTSFTGLYKSLFPADITPQNNCHEQAFPGTTYDDLSTRLAGAQSDLAKLTLGTADYTTKKSDVDQLLGQLRYRNGLEQSCILDVRQKYDVDHTPGGLPRDATSYIDRLYEWGKNVVAENIHKYLIGVKVGDVNVGIDMPIKDIRLMMDGNMQYLEAAAISMTANYVFVAIDNVRFVSCPTNEKSGSDCRVAVPAAMRITYTDISQALSGTNDNVDQLAAWVTISGETYDSSNQRFGYNGPLTGSNNFGDGVFALGQNDFNHPDSPVKSATDGYHFTTADYQKQLAAFQGQATKIRADCATANPDTNVIFGAYNNCVSAANTVAGNPIGKAAFMANPSASTAPTGMSFEETRQAVRTKVRENAMKDFQCKLGDALLWKIDGNVFPGFTRALTGGNAEIRNAALAKYLENGLKNGNILGFHFDPLNNLIGWKSVANYVRNKYFNSDPTVQGNAFGNFVKDGGFDFLTGYLSKNSMKWFGFKIDPSFASGLLVGLATGEWGFEAISLDGVFNVKTQSYTVKVGGSDRSLPTLGGALVNWAVSRLFSWTDKALGLPAGSTFTTAKMGYDVYKAAKAAQVLRMTSVGLLNGSLDNAVTGILGDPTLRDVAIKDLGLKAGATNNEITAAINKDPSKVGDICSDGPAVKDAQFKAAEGALVNFVIGILVDKLLGKTLAGVETSLGLVPGSLAGLVSTAIFNLVAPMLGLGPVGWTMALVGFVLINLFGVYKTEIWCSADGYYPNSKRPSDVYDRSISGSKNEISDLGVWGGDFNNKNLNSILQNKSQLAAQYKAKRLIGDMLVMQDNPVYTGSDGVEPIPIQIMTGRKDDPQYWTNLITTNVCQHQLGKSSKAVYEDGRAICDGDTKMGVWQNPQAVAWTHIGF